MKDQTQYAHYKEVLHSFSTAMLTTTSLEGTIISRPMAIADVNSVDDSIWFFTSRDTEKVEEIREHSVSTIVCMSSSQMLSIAGHADIVTDKAKMEEVWKETYIVWFPNGVNTPGLCLIRFEPVSAEYWDTNGFKGVRYLFEATKAILKGKTPDVENPDFHGKVEI